MPTVSIVLKVLPHYRVPFLMLLAKKLKDHGITLRVYHGEAAKNSVPVSVGPDILPQEIGKWTSVFHFRKRFLYHRLPNDIWASDLIIMSQANSILTNHFIQIRRLLKPGFKTAFWGHGKNFQSDHPNSLSERFKKLISSQVDWWFAYNGLSRCIVENLGFPKDRITSVENSIDTKDLASCRESLTNEDLDTVRSSLNTQSSNIAVYTGGLYKNKRIGFLLESAVLIRARIPDFELIVIGSGPERHLVSTAARKYPWIHDVGPKAHREIVPYWALSKVLLMPGGVGLVVLDSFALGVPMVTTDTRLHGPEIDYLKDGQNGLVVPCGDSARIYAEAVISLLNNPIQLDHLQQGALDSAKLYSIENMAENFSNGIINALGL